MTKAKVDEGVAVSRKESATPSESTSKKTRRKSSTSQTRVPVSGEAKSHSSSGGSQRGGGRKRPDTSDVERLNTLLPDIVARVKPGAPIKIQADSSVRIGSKGALVLGPAAGLWYDHEASTGGHSAGSLLKHLGVNGPGKWARTFLATHQGDGSLEVDPEDTSDSKQEASRQAMEHFASHAHPVVGTPAETYLKSRGINAPYPDNIGWVGQARTGEGAMVAIVSGPDGPIAVQLTYLTPEGHKSSTDPQRRTYRGQPDWQAGDGFRLPVKEAAERTIVVEGVEDALSLLQAKAGTVIIASLGLSNLGKTTVDASLPVIIFRDGDDPDSPASTGLTKGVDRLILQGAAVAITDTPLGSDANALLQSDGPGALVDLVDNAEPSELSIDGHITQCANLSVTEYEKVRTALAKSLDIRVTFLDKQVSARRRRDDDLKSGGNTLGIEEIEPWAESVVLGEVLDEIVMWLSRYIAADVLLMYTAALWSALAHTLSMVDVAPRLAAQSPGPGCGKTVLLEAISNLTPRPVTAASITAAVVFRIIEEVKPTLFLDEADQMLKDRSSPLVAVLNSSHRKSTAYVWRTEETVPGQFVPVRFSTWAAVMFAGIRELPPTLQDRSIVLRLQRARPGEVKQHIRDGKCDALAECGQKLARWAEDTVELPDVELPSFLTNRVGDNWRPLLAIAELAGGDWPARALDAAQAAVRHQEQGLISDLLADIYQIFGERDRILSKELVDGLIDLDEKPYGELNRGRAVTMHWLARQLEGVVTEPTSTMRSGNQRKKGYSRSAFIDAWARYEITTGNASELPPDSTVTTVTTGQPLLDNGYSDTDESRLSSDVTVASRLPDTVEPSATAGCHGVTDDTVGLKGSAEASPEDTESATDGDDTCLI
jgi:hypothetical protein